MMLIRQLIRRNMSDHVRPFIKSNVDPTTVPKELQKSVRVAFIGEPNSGKSSLINRYLDQHISIVTPVAQTTNRNVIGVVTEGDVQVIIVDTPGMPYFPGMKASAQRYESDHNQYVRPIQNAVQSADILVYICDPSEPVYTCYLGSRFKEIFDETDIPKYLVLNKIDIIKERSRLTAVQKQLTTPLVPNSTIVPIIERTDITSPLDMKLKYSDGVPFNDVFAISAYHGTNLEHLYQAIQEHAVLRPWEYAPDEVCPDSLEDVVCDLYREMLLKKLEGKIPFMVQQNVVYVKEKEGIVYIGHQAISRVGIFKDKEDFDTFRSEMTLALEERFGIKVLIRLQLDQPVKAESLDEEEEALF